MVRLPIATGYYVDVSRPVAAQECVNFFVKIPETNALSEAQLHGTPGISQFATAGTRTARGSHVMGGIMYSVHGPDLYKINENGTSTLIGVIDGNGPVSMADNGKQLCIVVPGLKGYIYQENPSTLSEIVNTNYTTDIGPSQQVVFKDGYFIHFNSNSLAGTGVVFFISNLNNGMIYNALDFGSAEADPDEITGIHVNKNVLYVAGEITNEPFQNIGVVAGDFPYQRIPGGIIQKGVKAKFSLADFDNGFVFVGGGENELPSVWKSNGGNVVKISTGAIDSEIRKESSEDQSNIFCTTDTVGGGAFLNVHLKNKVLTYDALATALMGKPVWFERRSTDANGEQQPWRVNGIVTAYGKTLVTDNQSSKIGELSTSVYTEYGARIVSIASTQPFPADGNVICVAEMELICESGVGLPGEIGGPDTDPVVIREYSDDGGFTFENMTARALGRSGHRAIRQIWRGEGMFNRSRVYRFTMSDRCKKVIIALEAKLV